MKNQLIRFHCWNRERADVYFVGYFATEARDACRSLFKKPFYITVATNQGNLTAGIEIG